MPVEVSKTPISSASKIVTSTTCPLEKDGVNEPNVDTKEETALSRFTKLQKSTMRGKPTPKRRASVWIGDSDARSLSGQSNNSRESSVSRKSTGQDTRLTPEEAVSGNPVHSDHRNAVRRHSFGGTGQVANTETAPLELIKKPIKPLGVPLATDRIVAPVVVTNENELICDKLEAIEERKDPDNQWAKVAKYTVHAARGFNSFSPSIGIGVFGVELQKAIRRQSDGLKHTLWEMKIRAPINNRIATGMALMSWGSGDGKTGTRTQSFSAIATPWVRKALRISR